MGQLEQQEQAFVQQPGTIQVFLKVSGFLNEGLYQFGLGRIEREVYVALVLDLFKNL